MDKILDFIINNPAYAVILSLSIILFVREFGVKNILSIIRGSQKRKNIETTDNHLEVMKELHEQNKVLAEQNRVFLTNHSMHEIPDILKSVDRIEAKVNDISRLQTSQGIDIARLKMKVLEE
ncbi:hypothetical protein M0R04_13895 [Candidatus Dojkabacteria bacterium]|jgi:hypothetical protein|nr:hypothetical protein [Candidatus Dojkabacteria bacterium]